MNKIRIQIISFILAVYWIPCVTGQNMDMPEKIILGTVYNFFHAEFPTDDEFYKTVDQDIPAISNANLNAVLVWPVTQWNPETKGLRWERGDYLVNKIEKEGLSLALILFKQQQCRHYFPIWKFDETENLKQAQMAQINGRWDVDFQIPQVKNILYDYIGEVLERYSSKPNMLLYNVWNEPHYYSESERNIARFREWLKEKYKTLDELNRVWGDDYTSWEQVSPLLDDNYDSSMPDIDWIFYKDDLIAELILELKEVVHDKDSLRPVNANPVEGLFMNASKPSNWIIDEWATARANDIHGISYYPNFWERGINKNRLAPFYRHNFVFNTLRNASQGKPYMMSEMQTNSQNGLAVVSYFDYNTMYLILVGALANDCKGFFFWKWKPIMRGSQTFGRGLTYTNGDLAPRGQAVKDVGALLKKYGRELYKAHPVKPKAAILQDKLSLLKSFENTFSGETQQIVHNSYEGTFKALFEYNIIPDVIRTDLEFTFEMISNYKIIYLPFQIVMRKNVAEILKRYVQSGGTLVADARTAILDEFDFGYAENPGAGLTELFGVTRIDHKGIDGSYKVTVTEPSVFVNVNLGDSFHGIYFKEEWELSKDCKAIAVYDDGSPAMAINKYGKGTAILSGVPLGASYLDNEKNPVNKIIAGLALNSDALPDVTLEKQHLNEVTVYLHQFDNINFIYVVNSSENDFSGKLTLQGRQSALEVINIVNNKEIAFVREKGNVLMDISIPAHRAGIFRIE
jgi:beta-galactosidase